MLYQQIYVRVEVSVNECTAHLANDNRVCMSWNYVTEVTCVSLSIFCVCVCVCVCVCNFPTASTVLWSKVKCLFYGTKTTGQHHEIREN